MKIIFGLGNPEKKYEKTYHNLGFMAAELLAAKLGCKFSLKSSLKAMVADTKIKGERVLIVKPLTYMNLSGECVQKVVSFFKVELEDIVVIYDDFDLDSGTIRYRPHGSAGTHNGMRNISLMLGSDNFKRIRIGTNPGKIEIPVIDFVLSKIPESENDKIGEALNKAVSASEDFIKGLSNEMLMCAYNGKKS